MLTNLSNTAFRWVRWVGPLLSLTGDDRREVSDQPSDPLIRAVFDVTDGKQPDYP